jgi:hypothetical protein
MELREAVQELAPTSKESTVASAAFPTRRTGGVALVLLLAVASQQWLKS